MLKSIMIYFFSFIAFIIFFLTIFILSQLFIKMKITFPNIQINNEVVDYINDKEEKIDSLEQNAKKQIIWNSISNKKTEYAIVFIHGSFATGFQQRESLIKIADKLEANLFISRLSGHGVGFEGTKGVSAYDFIEDTAEAIAVGNKIGDKVILIGFSAGSGLAMLASQDQKLKSKIHSLVLIAPPTLTVRPIFVLASIGLLFKRTHEFNFPKFNGLSYEEWGPYWVNKFESSLPRAFWKVLSSVKIKNDIDQLPMIIFYDKRDRVVNFERVEKIFDKWSGPKKIIDIKAVNGGRNKHNLIGILNPTQDDVFVNEIHKWISTNP